MIRDSSAMKGHGGFDLETSFGYSGLRDFAEPSQFTGSGDHWFCVLRNWFAPCLQWLWMVWYDMLSYIWFILFDMWLYDMIWRSACMMHDILQAFLTDSWTTLSLRFELWNYVNVTRLWMIIVLFCWFVAHRFEAAVANGLRTLNAVFDLNLQAPAFFASCGMFTALSSWNRHCFFNCSWFMIHKSSMFTKWKEITFQDSCEFACENVEWKRKFCGNTIHAGTCIFEAGLWKANMLKVDVFNY